MGSGAITPLILNVALSGGKWSASRSGHFTPYERATGTRWIGSWVEPIPRLDAVTKRKFSFSPLLGIDTRPFIP